MPPPVLRQLHHRPDLQPLFKGDTFQSCQRRSRSDVLGLGFAGERPLRNRSGLYRASATDSRFCLVNGSTTHSALALSMAVTYFAMALGKQHIKNLRHSYDEDQEGVLEFKTNIRKGEVHAKTPFELTPSFKSRRASCER